MRLLISRSGAMKRRPLHRAQRTPGHASARFSLSTFCTTKPCTRHELRDTTCSSQQYDWCICQSRSPHSFVQLRPCLTQLQNRHKSRLHRQWSTAECGRLFSTSFAREDAVRQMCGEHVNHVTSSREAGIRPAHLGRQV